MQAGTTMPIRPAGATRLPRTGSRLVPTLLGVLMGIAFAATIGRAPWVLFLGLGALGLAALWGGYDSRDESTLWRPPSPR